MPRPFYFPDRLIFVNPTSHQLRLAARIEEAYRGGGPEACVAARLYASPQGKEYKRLDALVTLGLVEKRYLRGREGRRVSAWVPPASSSCLAEFI